MAEEAEKVFLVDAYSDPVKIQVHGRVNFLNCSPLRTFIRKMFDDGKRQFVFDFTDCTGMDSTFLGILAGAAIELKKLDPSEQLVFTGLGERNLELIKNLGLHRICVLQAAKESETTFSGTGLDEGQQLSEPESARMVLDAHQNLIQTDPGNMEKFQDVITFLKNQVGDS